MNLTSLDFPPTPTAQAAAGEGAAHPGEEAAPTGSFGQMLVDALHERAGQELAADQAVGDETGLPPESGLADAFAGAGLLLGPPGPVEGPPAAWALGWQLAPAQPGPGSGQNLQSQNLGPTVRLITSAEAPPDDLSLADFARAQGLDERATRWLFGLSAAETARPAPPGAGLAAAPAGLPTGASAAAAPGIAMAQPGFSGVAGVAVDSDASLPGLLPTTLQWAGLTGGRERVVAAPSAGETDPAAALIAVSRKASVLVGVQGLGRQAAVRAGGDAALPAFVEVALDLDMELPLRLQGSADLKALQEWLQQAQPAAPGKGETLAPALAAADTAAVRLGASAPGVPLERSASPATEASLQRTEQHQALTQRMGEAIAQRLVAQMERGNWQVRLMLRPQSLGQVEVELRMRSGELEASFRAAQAFTRELINDSLPRLREVLSQMGMDVASFNIDGRQGQPSGGNSTPREQAKDASTTALSEAAGGTHSAASRPTRVGLDGWDVLV